MQNPSCKITLLTQEAGILENEFVEKKFLRRPLCELGHLVSKKPVLFPWGDVITKGLLDLSGKGTCRVTNSKGKIAHFFFFNNGSL